MEDLWFATDGGSYIYRFSSPTQKITDDTYNATAEISASERADVLGLIHRHFAGRFEIDSRPNRVSRERRIDLRNVQNRDQFIESAQGLLGERALPYHIYKAGRTSVKLVKSHKAEAIEYLMASLNLEENKMLVIADSARVHQIDRELLSRFVQGVSINVGDTSLSIGRRNPYIIQTESGMEGAISILESLASHQGLPMRSLLPYQNLYTESFQQDNSSDREPESLVVNSRF